MEEYYFQVPVTNSKVLCVGPITRDEAEAAGSDADFVDGFGYYLFIADSEQPRSPIEVLAKLASDDAVANLGNLLRIGNLGMVTGAA